MFLGYLMLGFMVLSCLALASFVGMIWYFILAKDRTRTRKSIKIVHLDL